MEVREKHGVDVAQRNVYLRQAHGGAATYVEQQSLIPSYDQSARTKPIDAEIRAPGAEERHTKALNGLSDLWLTGWLPAPYGQRVTAFRVYGPTGTRDMMSHLEQAHQADIRIRMADEQLSPTGIAIDATDVTEGIAYERDGVRVTVFDVDHGALIKPALAATALISAAAQSLLSGDTRFPVRILVKHARGARRWVIHEVMAAAGRSSSQREALDKG
jgi:hypothetical protein